MTIRVGGSMQARRPPNGVHSPSCPGSPDYVKAALCLRGRVAKNGHGMQQLRGRWALTRDEFNQGRPVTSEFEYNLDISALPLSQMHTALAYPCPGQYRGHFYMQQASPDGTPLPVKMFQDSFQLQFQYVSSGPNVGCHTIAGRGANPYGPYLLCGTLLPDGQFELLRLYEGDKAALDRQHVQQGQFLHTVTFTPGEQLLPEPAVLSPAQAQAPTPVTNGPPQPISTPATLSTSAQALESARVAQVVSASLAGDAKDGPCSPGACPSFPATDAAAAPLADQSPPGACPLSVRSLAKLNLAIQQLPPRDMGGVTHILRTAGRLPAAGDQGGAAGGAVTVELASLPGPVLQELKTYVKRESRPLSEEELRRLVDFHYPALTTEQRLTAWARARDRWPWAKHSLDVIGAVFSRKSISNCPAAVLREIQHYAHERLTESGFSGPAPLTNSPTCFDAAGTSLTISPGGSQSRPPDSPPGPPRANPCPARKRSHDDDWFGGGRDAPWGDAGGVSGDDAPAADCPAQCLKRQCSATGEPTREREARGAGGVSPGVLMCVESTEAPPLPERHRLSVNSLTKDVATIALDTRAAAGAINTGGGSAGCTAAAVAGIVRADAGGSPGGPVEGSMDCGAVVGRGSVAEDQSSAGEVQKCFHLDLLVVGFLREKRQHQMEVLAGMKVKHDLQNGKVEVEGSAAAVERITAVVEALRAAEVGITADFKRRNAAVLESLQQAFAGHPNVTVTLRDHILTVVGEASDVEQAFALVQRVVGQPPPGEPGPPTWQWQDKAGAFRSYSAEDTQKLEDAYAKFQAGVVEWCTLLIKSQVYEIDMAGKKQINTHTKEARNIQRIVQPAVASPPPHCAMDQDASITMWRGGSGRMVYDPVSLSTSVCATLVDINAWERQYVEGLVRTTWPVESIASIQHVWNPFLWEHFQINAKVISCEKYLFHGAGDLTVAQICNEGFERRLAGTTNGKVFGNGCYFARDANMAMHYTQKGGGNTMLLSRVLVGKYTRGSPQMLTAPKINQDASYDSTVDNEDNPRVFVTYTDFQAYPMYLITFKKKIWQ